LIATKQYGDFVEIVARLRARRPGTRAAIAGEGPLLADLRAQAVRLGVADAIDFLGRRTDIESVYREARVYVLTSRHEGLSIAMSEAMACGLPAVVSDVGELRDVVHDGRNGHVVPVGEVDEFAAHIGGLLADDAAYAAASTAARDGVVAHQSVDRLSLLYRDVLVGGGPA
jgi:glycosyltransferase involved in cell wall biosynthesis